jgi:hypothetical protein
MDKLSLRVRITLALLLGGLLIAGSLARAAWATPAQDPARQTVPTRTPSATPTLTPTPTSTFTPAPTATPTRPPATVAPTATPTPTSTFTPAPTATPTRPPATVAPTRTPASGGARCAAPLWDAKVVYLAGDVVSHAGSEWKARSQTQEEPGVAGGWEKQWDCVMLTTTPTLPPPIIMTATPTATGTPGPRGPLIPRPVVVVLGSMGVLALLGGLVLFVLRLRGRRVV